MDPEENLQGVSAVQLATFCAEAFCKAFELTLKTWLLGQSHKCFLSTVCAGCKQAAEFELLSVVVRFANSHFLLLRIHRPGPKVAPKEKSSLS